ncbi:MAG TPA: glycoside hydrolase family 3 N-terminal domain-containing protein, partial [Polyangiaceae bacterium]|nr:glycoside hydrolase family 3 N-terminal domain-containing protein [Polyangiaceae bacterium]
MAQHDSSTARRRRSFHVMPLLVLAGAVVAAASCSRLEDANSTADGGGGSSGGGQGSSSGASSGATSSGGPGSGSSSGDMVVSGDAAVSVQKMACGNASTTTDAWSPGYTIPSSAISSAQTFVSALPLTQQATIMRGETSGCPNSKQFAQIFDTPGLTGASGIQGYKFRDGPRGVCLIANSTVAVNQGNYSTTFPSGSARGATFDMNLEQQIGAAMADEMVASGHNMILAPVINILRHPAWGRSQETYGEDSFLLGRLGTAYVSGVQGYVNGNQATPAVAACAKHFAAYNIENGRDTGNIASMDEQTAYEVYGRHFEMVVQEGGVACIMAAYNLLSIGGSPAQHCTSNKALLTDMLRTTFGFKGFVISDWWAMPGGSSCPAADTEKQYTSDAVNAGLDMELPWDMNFSQLEADVTGGTLMQSQVAASATRIAAQQYRFSFATPGAQPPGTPTTSFNTGTYSITNNDAHVALA